MEYLKFLLIGIVGGTASGFFGIGGGIIMIPLLVYLVGVELKAATAMSMVQIVFSSISGTLFNYFQKTINFKYSAYFGVSAAAFSFLGSYLTKYIPNLAIKIIYLFAVIAALFLFFLRRKIEDKNLAGSEVRFYKIMPVGAVAGFTAGLLGVGGGFIFVPALLFFCSLPMKIAVGTSLGAIIFVSIPGVIGKVISVDFDIMLATAIGIGAVGGSKLGTYLNRKVNSKIIRIFFALLLLAMITRVAIDLLNH
jgi:uncharacterized membrane protein YfcA